MAQQTINGKDGGADFSIGTQSYRTVLTSFTVRAAQQLIDITTFNEEGTVKNDPGTLVLGIDLVGLLTKGHAAAGPLIPPPQDADLVLTFSAGCTITCTADFTEATARRVVNANGLITASAVAQGSITKVWVMAAGSSSETWPSSSSSSS